MPSVRLMALLEPAITRKKNGATNHSGIAANQRRFQERRAQLAHHVVRVRRWRNSSPTAASVSTACPASFQRLDKPLLFFLVTFK